MISSRIKLLIVQLKTGMLQLLTANVLNKAISMLTNMIITRTLSIFDYGVWSYSLNIYSYLDLISGLGLAAGAYQFGTEKHGTEEGYTYYKYCLKNGIIINAIISILCIICFSNISFAIPEAKIYTIVLCPFIILQLIMQILLYVFLSDNRIAEYARTLNINTLLSAACVCIGSVFGIEGVLIGKYLSMIVSLTQIIYKLRNEILQILKAHIDAIKSYRGLWHYSLITGATAGLNLVLYLLDVTMIGNMIGNADDIAMYKIATLIPTALSFIPNSVISSYLPRIIYHRDDEIWLKRNIKRLFGGMGAINAFLCPALIFLAPYIVAFISGSKYLPSVPCFIVLIIGYFFSGSLGLLSTNILSGLKKVNFNLIISCVSCLCDVIFNYFFIRRFQVIGAAYATLSVQIISSCLESAYLIYIVYLKRKLA